jgi:hypothetical protein
VAIALAAGGTSFVDFAGAQDQSQSKVASKGRSCYHESYYIKFTERPKNPTTERRATFRFRAFRCFNDSTVLHPRFKCKLDDANRYRKCRKPVRYRHLDRGKHRFKVKARAAHATGTGVVRWLITS